jgi:hypothetical protein
VSEQRLYINVRWDIHTDSYKVDVPAWNGGTVVMADVFDNLARRSAENIRREQARAEAAEARVRELEAALREARSYVDGAAPDWHRRTRETVALIDEALGASNSERATASAGAVQAKPCHGCNGSGVMPGSQSNCGFCDGTGEQP